MFHIISDLHRDDIKFSGQMVRRRRRYRQRFSTELICTPLHTELDVKSGLNYEAVSELREAFDQLQ